MNPRKNNFDLVRLFAACLVIYSHSFTLLAMPDRPVMWITPGGLGVYIFFAVSGFLIAQSWDADPHLLRYLTRRALRIFPGLAVCVLLCVLVLGPAMTKLSPMEYFTHPLLRQYLGNIALHISYELPGVFSSNPYPRAVNGSLWTLPVEFSLYLLVALLGLAFRANRWAWLGAFVLFAAGCIFWAYLNPPMVIFYAMDTRHIAISGIYFVAGACFHKFGLTRYFSTSSVVAALVLLMCLVAWPVVERLASWILLPWAVLGFGLARSDKLMSLVKSGDYSYGVYIYAFPIQQTILSLFPGIQQPTFLLYSLAATFVAAALSWHLIEKPALGFKPRRIPSHQEAIATIPPVPEKIS